MSSAIILGVSRPKSFLNDLPLELQMRIVEFLDTESPSSKNLHQEPSAHLTKSTTRALKNLSAASKRLRSAAIQTLFKFAALTFPPQEASCRQELGDLVHFFRENGVRIASVTVRFSFTHSSPDVLMFPDDTLLRICSTVVNVLNPETFILVFPSVLRSCLVPLRNLNRSFRDDGWAFDMPLHVLRLKSPSQSQACGRDGTLWDNSWSCVSLNEGSSLKVYSTYEYFLKDTPSLFHFEYLWKYCIRQPWSVTVQKFDYIAIFPLPSHISRVLGGLRFLHNLRTFTTRLKPHEADSWILTDPDRVGKCQLADLWMEFEACYSLIVDFVEEMGELQNLIEFKSLDCDQSRTAQILIPHFSSRLLYWERTKCTWSKVVKNFGAEAVSI